MKEGEKMEAYLSSVRHDLRSEIMVIREGVSIILDNLVGSNCDNCFALLRHALKSTDQLNKLIEESLTSSRLTKMAQPFLSAKEEELERVKEQLLDKGEELVCVKKELLRKEEESTSIRRDLQAKEDELKEAKKGPQGHGMEVLTYELTGMVSHIIRTPLAIIKESLSLVLDEIPGELNAKQKELLSNGKKSLDSLVFSIEELSRESWPDASLINVTREKRRERYRDHRFLRT